MVCIYIYIYIYIYIIYFNQKGNIPILNVSSLKLVDKFNYLGSSVLSTENHINKLLSIAWSNIDRLLIIR